jgi:hypothetical protein
VRFWTWDFCNTTSNICDTTWNICEPNKISRKFNRVDAFWTTSNICEILFDDVSWRWCVQQNAEHSWNIMKQRLTKSHENLIVWTHTHSSNICEIFMRFLFDVVSWVFFYSSYEASWNIVKQHETSSNKISRKSHRVDRPFDVHGILVIQQFIENIDPAMGHLASSNAARLGRRSLYLMANQTFPSFLWTLSLVLMPCMV